MTEWIDITFDAASAKEQLSEFEAFLAAHPYHGE